MAANAEYRFTVNGEEQVVTTDKPLLRYLRDDLKLTSVKDGCSEGACGTCTVLVDDRANKACVLTTRLAAGRDIVTVEGLPHEEQEAFVYAFGAVGAVQCGFCIPGMVMAGAALIHKVPDPTEDQVKVAIRGNVCRCTGYKKIIEGILLAAAIIPGTPAGEQDFDTEFLNYILAIAVVDDVDAAIAHIARHSTHHSEAIITADDTAADRFTTCVDSAAVYVNASTRFTDGGEFGLGCEMGISTQKLHARGPMGLAELCSYKYIIHGSGQTRGGSAAKLQNPCN